jgi:hypothetical protein
LKIMYTTRSFAFWMPTAIISLNNLDRKRFNKGN